MSARADILDELKYQLSNSDEGSRPARDLVENPVAAAYLVVLALFGGGLAYLLWLDTQASAKREAALREQEAAIAMMREQGFEEEAAVLAKDLKAERKPKPKPPPGMGPMDKIRQMQGGSQFAEDDPGNRFERRQGREARKQQKSKRKNRKASRQRF